MSKGTIRPGEALRPDIDVVPSAHRFVARARWVGIAFLTLLVAQSIIWAPAAGPILKGLVVAVGLVSYASPSTGLLAVAALTPLGAVMTTRLFAANPTRLSEALVLACLAVIAAFDGESDHVISALDAAIQVGLRDSQVFKDPVFAEVITMAPLTRNA